MADASSSGSGARNAAEPVAAQLEARERLISKNLKSSREKLWVQSQAFAERSRIRTARGGHTGALRDAKRALALFPKRVEYLVRAAEALLDCGHAQQASKVAQKAEDAIKAAGEDSIDVESRLSLTRLNKRLRPFDQLPNEVLATIFELVYSDWEHLPSPFQVCHISTRWREVAFATPTLWRDTRILRLPVKLATTQDDLCDVARRPPVFPHEATIPPQCSSPHPKTTNHLRLLGLCDSLSRSTLRHFEYHTCRGDGDLARRMLEPLHKSLATLRSLSIIAKEVSGGDLELGLSYQSLSFALRCITLVDLELSTSEMSNEDRERLEHNLVFLPPPTSPSFLRTLRLDVTDCYNLSYLPLARQALITRASQTRRLTLLDLSQVVPEEGGVRKFASDLLASCAASLEELDADACANLIRAACDAGVTAFPRLRRLRYVPKKGHGVDVGLISIEQVPRLETVEAPIQVICAFDMLPARTVLQVFEDSDLKSIAEWLESLNAGPQHLTLELICRPRTDTQLKGVLDVLTPSIAGKVVCPRLVTLNILCRDAIRRDGSDDNVFSLDFAPRRKPTTRDQWMDLLDASKLARIEAERRRVSQGLPAEEDPPSQFSPAFTRGAMPLPSSPAARHLEEATTVLPHCEPLRSVTIESCFLKTSAWAAMEASSCDFTATPSPDEMFKLPWEGGEKRRHSGER